MVIKYCLICNKQFKRPYAVGKKNWEKAKFCSQTCYHKSHEGIPSWNKGKHWSKEWKNKRSKRYVGSGNPSWKGGTIRHDMGYILIFSPNHPSKNFNGYVYEHRLKMEEYLGRYLTKEEVIHHVNGKKDDNRIENLKLFPNHSEHIKEDNRWTRQFV